MKIKYKGYVVIQSNYNNHVSVYKDEKMIFHSSMTEKLNKDNLEQLVDLIIQMQRHIIE